MNLQLQDKVVLVTGGAKGIGAATVLALAQEGAVPVIVDKDAEAGENLRAKLSRAGTRAVVISTDLTSPENCRESVERVVRDFGQLDALVNNAAINDRVGLEHGSPDQYVSSLQRNLLHYYDMAHYALPELKRSRGSIVNISSKTAITGQGGTSGYASSKGAILALTREWAAELLPYGIRVNAIVPAEVMTPLYQQWLNSFPNAEEKLKTILSKIPLDKRMTRAEEIAAMIVFLISAKAEHITGQHLFIDGGYVHLDRALT
jgi:L-fucose dehydrogenase